METQYHTQNKRIPTSDNYNSGSYFHRYNIHSDNEL